MGHVEEHQYDTRTKTRGKVGERRAKEKQQGEGMIRVTGITGSNERVVTWYFIIGYDWRQNYRTTLNRVNTKGAKTFFWQMIQREKKAYELRELFHEQTRHMQEGEAEEKRKRQAKRTARK